MGAWVCDCLYDLLFDGLLIVFCCGWLVFSLVGLLGVL